MTMQRGQACLRRFQGTVRATHAIREQRTRVRARTPACGQARHEVAVNFTTDRTYFQTAGHFPRATTASQLAREQAVTEWACALRIRTSQSESEEADCFYQRSIPNLSPLAVAIPATKARNSPCVDDSCAAQNYSSWGNHRQRWSFVKAKEPWSSPPSVLLFC